MKSGTFKYLAVFIWGLLLWTGGGNGSFAQTSTGLESRLILREEKNFLLCNDEGKQFRTYVYNDTDYSGFRDGTYEIDQGNGKVMRDLSKADFPQVLTYTESGEYTLKFSALTTEGTKVSRVYTVRALSRPIVSLVREDENAKCIGSDVYYTVDVANKNSSGTIYTLDYDDGSRPDVMTNEELKAAGGVFTHRYDHSYCDLDHFGSSREMFRVRLTVKNECDYIGEMTVGEYVVRPLVAMFTFDKKKHCTYEKVKLKNISWFGGNSDCTVGPVFWEWYYGDGKQSNAFEPELTFEEAGNYPIKLIATNAYSCANDTTTEQAILIDRVKAIFRIATDTLCSGDLLEFRNLSLGDELKPFRWQIVPEDGGPVPSITNGNFTVSNPQILFDHYGRYRVTLIASNDCSEDWADTVIVVKQDPNIQKFDLPEYVCPPRLDLSEYVRFEWNGNEVRPEWTIVRENGGTGYTFVEGTDRYSEFPQVDFSLPGKYRVTVRLKTAGCGGTVLEKSGVLTVQDPQLTMKATAGASDICEGSPISFRSSSIGENIMHRWTVVPSANTSFAGGTLSTDRNPLILFDKYGEYEVGLHLKTACLEKDTVFEVHVRKESHIAYFEPQAAVCPEDIIDFHDCIIYQFWNNPEKAEWTIEPATGFEFVNGTDEHSTYPVVRFKTPGSYDFTVKLEAGSCSRDGVVQQLKRTVKVRNSSMTLRVTAVNTTVCEGGSLPFSMTATAAEDDPIIYGWTVFSESAAEDYVFEDYGNQKSVAKIRFDKWGTYKVRGEARGFCGTLDSVITVRVKKDPEVRLRDTAGICPGRIELSDYVGYEWYNNAPEAVWEIVPASSGTPADGFVYTEGTGPDAVYPVVDFRKKGSYRLRVTVPSVGCKEEFLTDQKMYTVYDTTILVDVNPLGDTDICEGETVRFRNMSEGAGLVYRWQVEGPEGGWIFLEGTEASSQAPVFQFLQYGEYSVTVFMEGSCNRKEKTFAVKVRGIPEVVLSPRLSTICEASAPVDMQRYVEYRDLKNCDVSYYWSVSPDEGYEFESGYGRREAYPRIRFNANNKYTVGLEVYSQCAAGGVQELQAGIDVLEGSLKAGFSVDSAVCVPAVLVLDDCSQGDSLSYRWSVRPVTVSGGGWEIPGEGRDTVRFPELNLTEQGYYDVTLSVRNLCGEDDSSFRIKAFAVPEVQVSDKAGVCEPFAFSAQTEVRVEGNNDAIRKAEWTVTSVADYDDFDRTDLYPDIVFHAGEFRVNVRYWNRCAQPGEGSFTVKADEFIPIQPLRDTAVCVLTDAFLLHAAPGGGSWTSETGRVLYEGGQYFFDPRFDAYFEGDAELVYNLPNGACLAKDTMKVHLYPLPHVEAGEDLQMCLNHDPLLLEGQPAGGHWESGGGVLPEDVYTPVTAGDFPVYYYFTDGHGCVNRDSLILTVHPLPVTVFRTDPLPCRYAEALFIPDQPEGNRFEWDFGDGSPRVVSEADTVHVYRGYGFYEVSNVATSVHGCVDRSVPVRIEVVDLPPEARFDVDRTNGCAPVYVQIRIDSLKYKEDHNYLSFSWDYGEGTVTDRLMPIVPKFYPEGLWDTAYVTRFTVRNQCGESSYDTVITVNSHPVASFKLMHRWECSPVSLELQNTTTGNRCEFTWDFGDGSPVSHVYNASHEYTTGAVSTEYHITLVAENKCGRSEYTDSLIVKPRSISAHFAPEKVHVCVGEEVCFKNNSTDTVGMIENIYWNFGDGARDSLWDVCHSYSEAGDYAVLLWIENGCGFDTISDRIRIHPLPQLTLSVEDHLCETDTFTFVVRSDQELKRVTWDFGDGHGGMKDSMRYVYDGYGRYHVSVRGVCQYAGVRVGRRQGDRGLQEAGCFDMAVGYGPVQSFVL